MADAPTTIATILQQWEEYGVFDYVLPFLLLFALIFGITTKVKMWGENKMVNTIISVVIALLALRVGYIQVFFMEFFPRLGVGLTVLLGLVILVAVFVPTVQTKGWSIAFYTIGSIIAFIIIFGSLDRVGWLSTNLWNDWGALIIGALLVGGVIIAIVVPANSEPSKEPFSKGGTGFH